MAAPRGRHSGRLDLHLGLVKLSKFVKKLRAEKLNHVFRLFQPLT